MARGIYLILHAASGRAYVGQSICVEARWNEHRKSLTKGKHHCNYLQRAWHKYGADAFTFKLAHECEEETDLTPYEQIFMDAFKGKLFNSRTAGARGLHSDESKTKMREAQLARFGDGKVSAHLSAVIRGQHKDPVIRERRSAGMVRAWERTREARSGANHHGIRAVTCLDTNEQFISISAAANHFGLKHDALQAALKLNRPCNQKHFAFTAEVEQRRAQFNAFYAAGGKMREHPIVDVETGEELENAAALSVRLGFSKNALYSAIKQNRRLAGRLFDYKTIIL